MTELLSAQDAPGWFEAAWRMTAASGIVLALAVGADLLLARRVSARWRAALFLAVFVRLLLPASWGSAFGLLGGPGATEPGASATVAPAKPVMIAARTQATGAIAEPLPAGILLHGSVALALAAAWARARVRAARTLAGATPASARVRALAFEGEVWEHPSQGPAVFGLLKPRIVVPSPLASELDDEALGAVLRHEVAHVKRRDPLRLMLLQLATFAAWPVVPAWIAAWRVRGLMEQACDEAALAGANAVQRRSYGEALLRVAEWQPLPTRLALGMLPFGGGLVPRLRALRFTRRWPLGLQIALVASLATATVLASGERTAEQPPAGAGGTSEARVVQLDFAAWSLDESKVAGLPFPSRAAAAPETLVLFESVSPLDDGALASVRDSLAAAEKDAHASVLSRPRILVRDGEQASIESSFGDASVLTLAATPSVGDDGSIHLVMDFSHGAGEELQSVTRASGRLPLLMISRSGGKAVVVLATGRLVGP